MSQLIRCVLVAVLVVTSVGIGGTGTAGAQDGTPPSPPLSWQSAGDSYASGEGVFGNVGDCAQSDEAYGPLATVRLSDAGWQIPNRTFTACTGHLIEDYFTARPDTGGKQSMWDWGREQGGPERVDVITMTFGGNDIGFRELLFDCLDLPTSWRDIAPTGCDVAEADLTARVDHLLDPPQRCDGSRRSGSAGFDCDLDIGGRRGSIVDFYADVATSRLSERGRLYVVGYPRLFAPVDQWPGWIKTACQGITRGDTEKLGRVAEHFNRKLIETVRRVNAAIGEERVHFVDRLADFSDGNHELCGSGEDYLNGIARDRGEGPGIRFQTSFHPNAAGHRSTADDLVEIVRQTFPTAPPPIRSIDLLNAELPANSCVSDGIGWASPSIRLANGAGESVGPDGGFGGASIDEAELVGYSDLDGDGVEDAMLSVMCFGSTAAQCCAGRTSKQMFALPVRVTLGGRLAVIGGPITGLRSAESYSIDEVRLDGREIETVERLAYPEQVDPAEVGHDPFQPVTVRYRWGDGRWTGVITRSQLPAPPAGDDEMPYSLEDCRRLGIAEISSADKFQRGAVCLFQAWRADDRALAEEFADPPAVATMFDTQWGAGPWRFMSCPRDPSTVLSLCILQAPGPFDPREVTFRFTAYDDVVAVVQVQG